MAPAPSIAAALILLTKLIIYRENPAKFPETNASLWARTRAARGRYLSTVPLRKSPAKSNSMGPSVRPNFLFCFILFFINIMSPAPPIAAALILMAFLLIEKNPRNIPVWQKIRQSIPQLLQFNRATAGGTVNLHFSSVRIKQ